MGFLAARFFAHVQGARFYRQMLADALALLGDPDHRTLLDVGCGPGALTRLAAAAGYRAIGIDSDPAMITTARRLARRDRSTATFAHADLSEAADIDPQADIVVAASLLATTDDPAAALQLLWRGVTSGGALLIIEPNERMTVANARRIARDQIPRPRRHLLTLWAHARQRRTFDPRLLDSRPPNTTREDHPLLAGLVTATILERATAG